MTDRIFSQDDANLNQSALPTARARLYSDLNPLFEPNPNTGDLYLLKDAAAVKQSVKNIVMCNMYDRPFNPNFKSDIRALLFENVTAFTIARAKEYIKNAITNNEPRVTVTNVIIDTSVMHTLNITVSITINSTNERATVVVNTERLR